MDLCWHVKDLPMVIFKLLPNQLSHNEEVVNITPEEMCEYAQVHLRFMPPKAAKTDNS